MIVDTRGELIKIDHVVDDQGSIVGELQNGGVTDDTMPTLSGQATPNSQVNIYDNGVLIGTAPVDANGQCVNANAELTHVLTWINPPSSQHTSSQNSGSRGVCSGQ